MNYNNKRWTAIVIGLIAGISSSYYFWKLTLLIPDTDTRFFVIKVMDFAWQKGFGQFVLFLILFLVGWLLVLLGEFFEIPLVIVDWPENYLWFNIIRAAVNLFIVFLFFYFFSKSLIILFAFLIASVFIYFLMSVFFNDNH